MDGRQPRVQIVVNNPGYCSIVPTVSGPKCKLEFDRAYFSVFFFFFIIFHCCFSIFHHFAWFFLSFPS